MNIHEVIKQQILEIEDIVNVLILANQELEDVYDQRDMLLKACKEINRWFGTENALSWDYGFAPPWYQQLYAAISRAEQAEQEGGE